jgi:hypothetical protein
MQKIDIAVYARLASCLNSTMSKNSDFQTANPKVVGTNLIILSEMLKDFIRTETELGESVPKRLVELQNSIDAYLDKWKSSFPKDKFETPLHFMEYKILEDSAMNASSILYSSFPIKPIYFVTAKAGYNIDDLLDNGIIFIDKDVRAFLPKNAIDDVNQGIRCLAFELWTASAFHLARAVETALLLYHKTLVKNAPSQRNWGTYIRELRTALGDKKTLDSVDSFREHHRNPITHPEISLDERKALSLFPMAIHVINVLIAQIDANSPNPKGLIKKIF